MTDWSRQHSRISCTVTTWIAPAVMAAGIPCGLASAAEVILNEYNAVGGSGFLEGLDEDAFWGRREGNGDDWFELVVVADHVDMRGWDLVITNDTGDPVDEETFVLTLSEDALWSDLRSGTIITVSEDLANNVDDYQPETGQWWINVKAADATSGTYITPSNFSVSNNDWQLTILDAFDQVVFGPAGEGVNPTSGVGNDEVFKLEEDPTVLITPGAAYNDGSSSSFGAPNLWSSGQSTQDFSALRGVVPYAPLDSVRINEINAHTDPPDEDWIEIYNTTGAPIDIGGWYLSDDVDDLMRFVIPLGTVLPAGGFHVITETELPFAFSSTGERVFLSEADGIGNMTGGRDWLRYGAVENGVTVGRTPDGTGPTARLLAPTLGGPNAGPIVGPVVINEIMYHPPPPMTTPMTDIDPEYIELYNNTNSAVDLYRDFGPDGLHPWRLSGGVDFDFSFDTTIPRKGFLLVVNFDPDAEPDKLADFLAMYDVDEEAEIVGPYSGGLGNFSDAVRLRTPDTPNITEVPMITIDEVTYYDFGVWPTAADGDGPSLERYDATAIGDDPDNWAASRWFGGSPGSTNSATFLRMPAASAWGLAIMALVVASVGTLLIRGTRNKEQPALQPCR